jgi:ATP-binding cassette, subfamily C (CFTR/MRP), member 1
MYADPSLESTGGIFSQSLFLWMNVQLNAGYRRLLSMDDLLSVDESLCSKELEGGGLQRRWNTSMYNDICEKKPEQKLIKEPVSKKWPGNALLIASIQEYKWAIAAGVIPRLCQIGFVFAQPFLVKSVVLLMVEENSRATTFTGYGLIAAYGLVYLGITVGLLCTSSDLNLSDH